MTANAEQRAGNIEPQPGPQRMFHRTPADIAVYGGAAGGGKTFSLLLEPTRHLDKRGFGAVIFRRTYPQIMAEGGLWDESAKIYPWIGGRPIVGDVEWRFTSSKIAPTATTISFRHLQHDADRYDWQGSQIPFLGFDELSHFTKSQFWYLLGRNRTTCGVRPYVRATTNPDPGWVRELLAPWVDDEFDGPRAESGEVRWFLHVDGQMRWVPRGTPDAKSLTFIRASVYDNKILLRTNPEYLANLKAQTPVERARLLDGNWNIKREGLVYAGFESCIVESAPERQLNGGGIDFGLHNPFAALWGFLDHDDVLWVTGCRYVRQCTIPTHAEAIPRGLEYWADPAGAEQIRQLRHHGHSVRPCVHLPTRGAGGEKKTPKLAGIDRVSERIRTGRLKIVRSTCLPLIRELGLYRYDPSKETEEPVDADNHACDALRYWIVGLDRRSGPGTLTAARIEAEARQREAHEREKEAADEAARQVAHDAMRHNPYAFLKPR